MLCLSISFTLIDWRGLSDYRKLKKYITRIKNELTPSSAGSQAGSVRQPDGASPRQGADVSPISGSAMAASSQASNRGVPPRSTPGSPFSLKSSPNYRPAGYGSAGLTPPLEGGVGRARAPSFELPPPMQSLPGKSTPNINVIPEGEAQVRSYQASYTVC